MNPWGVDFSRLRVHKGFTSMKNERGFSMAKVFVVKEPYRADARVFAAPWDTGPISSTMK